MKMANFLDLLQYKFILALIILCLFFPYVALFLLIITFIVAIHEFGHLISARRHGVTVTTYSIGMGKRLCGWVSPKSGIDYRLSALPIGGYVRMLMKEEDGNDAHVTNLIEKKQGIKHVQDIHYLKRIEVMIAGIALNFVTAIIFFTMLIVMRGETVVDPLVDTLKPSTTIVTELQAGDRILAVEGQKVAHLNEAVMQMMIHGEKPIQLTVTRNNCKGETCPQVIVQHQISVNDEGSPDIGFYVSRNSIKHYEINILDGMLKGTQRTWDLISLQAKALGRMITGQLDWQKMLSGPVGIAKVTGDVFQSEQQASEDNTSILKPAVMTFIKMCAIISVAIGFMNLLPLPALDGGHILFTCIEWVRGKPLSATAEERFALVGFGMIMLLFALGLYADLGRIS